jgi:hypothetical protein
LEESELTPKQRKWLEASKEIGPGAMTKTERERLEKLYADMLPAEQQELQHYIQEKFGKQTDSSGNEHELPDDPIGKMEERQWSEPSEAFTKAFSKQSRSKKKFTGE